MTLHPAMLELMPDSVTIEPFISQTSARVATYGASVSYRAQVLPHIERVVDRNGVERRSTGEVIIPERVAIDDRSRLTIVSPAGYVPSQPPIMAVKPYGGVLGLDSTQILF